ncbi:MAG: hypothetical protein ACOCTI_04755 [Phycisphaeraceae bacterium]
MDWTEILTVIVWPLLGLFLLFAIVGQLTRIANALGKPRDKE